MIDYSFISTKYTDKSIFFDKIDSVFHDRKNHSLWMKQEESELNLIVRKYEMVKWEGFFKSKYVPRRGYEFSISNASVLKLWLGDYCRQHGLQYSIRVEEENRPDGIKECKEIVAITITPEQIIAILGDDVLKYPEWMFYILEKKYKDEVPEYKIVSSIAETAVEQHSKWISEDPHRSRYWLVFRIDKSSITVYVNNDSYLTRKKITFGDLCYADFDSIYDMYELGYFVSKKVAEILRKSNQKEYAHKILKNFNPTEAVEYYVEECYKEAINVNTNTRSWRE